MDEKNIMVNKDVVDVTEEIVTVSSRKGLKVVGALGVVALVGAAAYWGYRKLKAKKEQDEEISVDVEVEIEEDQDEESEE